MAKYRILTYVLAVRPGEETWIEKDLDAFTGGEGRGVYNLGAEVRDATPDEEAEIDDFRNS